MFAFARVGIFVKRRAVEKAQTLLVARKVCKHPIQNDAYACSVATVDKLHKVFGRAVARSRSKHTRGLITPASVERIFGERHNLNVRVSHLFDVRDKLVRHRAVIDIVAVRILFPRAEMNLVNVDRRAVRIEIFPLSHPFFVFPAISGNVIEFGCVCGCGFKMQTIRVALEARFAFFGRDCVFVRLKLSCSRNKSRPHAVVLSLHAVCVYVPIIEIAHNRYGGGVGSPHGEIPAVDSVLHARGGRKHLMRLIICAFMEQIACITVFLFCHYFLQKQIPYRQKDILHYYL